MLQFNYFRSSTLIGLDIQAHEIRFLQLRHVNGQVRVLKAAIAVLPKDVIVEGKIQKIEVMSDCLQELVTQTRTTGSAAAVALPAHCVISKKVKLTPGLRGIERTAEIAENVSRYFPGAEDLTYHSVTINITETGIEEVLLVAARSDQLVSYVSAVENAGLKLKMIDVDIYALTRAMIFNAEMINAQPMLAFLDVGEYLTQLVVMYRNEIIFHQPIQNTLSQEVCRQIRYALQLCHANHPDFKLNKIYLSGMPTDLTDTLRQDLSVNTEYISPFEKVTHTQAFQSLAQKMLLCCGLALRGIVNGRN